MSNSPRSPTTSADTFLAGVLSPSVEANANMDVDADKEQAGPSIEEPIMKDTPQEMDKDVAEAEQEPEMWRPKRKGRKVWR